MTPKNQDYIKLELVHDRHPLEFKVKDICWHYVWVGSTSKELDNMQL